MEDPDIDGIQRDGGGSKGYHTRSKGLGTEKPSYKNSLDSVTDWVSRLSLSWVCSRFAYLLNIWGPGIPDRTPNPEEGGGVPTHYRPQRSCGKVCFHRHLWFCPWGGGCLADTHPSWADTPPSRHSPGQTAPWADPPPPADGYCCGWYASYWNAFLFV